MSACLCGLPQSLFADTGANEEGGDGGDDVRAERRVVAWPVSDSRPATAEWGSTSTVLTCHVVQAQATQKHAARINHAHRLARSQEQQRAHEAEEAHHILFARERQRADARAESGDGPASDPSEFSCAGRAAGGVTVRGCSTGGAAAEGSVRDRDFGWSGAAGRRCAQGGTGGPRAGGKTCMSIQRCAQGGEGEAVEGVTRCPLVKKVAVGKDPTLFE